MQTGNVMALRIVKMGRMKKTVYKQEVSLSLNIIIACLRDDIKSSQCNLNLDFFSYYGKFNEQYFIQV